MKNEDLDLLILRYLSGELGPEEAAQLRARLERDPDAARRVLVLADEELLFRSGFQNSGAGVSRRRSWRLWAAAGALLLAVLAGYGIFGPGKVVARIDTVSGSVLLLPGRDAAKPGQGLQYGQGLETTGSLGGATLTLTDGTRIRLDGDTRLSAIEDGGKGRRLSVPQGSLRATVVKQPAGKPLVFSTPQGDAEVLGTTLGLQVDSKKGTRLGVEEGKVRLKNRAGLSVDVSGGHYAVAAAGVDLVVLRTLSIPPYSIPEPGNAAAIGVNRAVDVAASISTPASSMATALFGAFGGGTFIRDYSERGAYVLTALGGHASPTAIAGAVLFDFQDASWKGFENANGIASNGNGWTANSTGDPWQEWTGTEVPLPCHPYLIAAELPASRGGGPKGSVVFIGRAAVTSTGGGGRGPHALNLETRRWSRLTSADHPRLGGIYTSVVFDDSSGRYYSVAAIEQRKDVPYYDSADWSQIHATTPQYGWSAFGGGSRAFLDPARRMIIDFADNRELHALQLDNPGIGWTVLPVTGALPEITSPEPNRFVFYPPDGNFYYRPVKNGGAVLHRLRPPAAGTTAWTADTVQLNQSLPDCDSVRMNDAWYSFFFYVPSIQCLGWIVGPDKPVYILKPPGTAAPASAAPWILTPPEAQSVVTGETATFSVVAGGTAPFSYQWQKNGVDIPGAHAASVMTAAALDSDNGAAYRVIVSNAAGSVTSGPALLTVSAAPTPPAPAPAASPEAPDSSGKCGCGMIGGTPPWPGIAASAVVLLSLLFRRRG